MKKKVCFVLIAVAALTGCRQHEQQEEDAAARFETMTVSKQDITLEQSYPAQIEGRQSVKIIPRVEGYLRQICVKEGQRVKKGQVLFVIDQATYQAEVKAAEANVAVAKAGVETAQLNYDSRQTLHGKNIVSDYDLRTATANLSMAKAQSQQAQAQLQSARTNLSYTVLRSPSDGVVRLCNFEGKYHTLNMTLEEVESQLDPQRFMRVNRQFIISAVAVQKLSTYFLGKMRIHMTAAPDEEIIVSKDKVATVKRWLDS